MRTKVIRRKRLNYGKAAFMVFSVCAVAFVLTNAIAKFMWLGCLR